jgi:glycosyltransferase involved in cell wall biosynthesis
MKVLIYSATFFPTTGGVQTIVSELARGLAGWQRSNPGAEAIDVTLVTRTPGRAEQDKGQTFQIVRRPKFLELVRLMHNADVVHLAGPALLPLGLALLLRKHVVLEHHGFQAGCPNGLLFFEPTGAPCPGHFMAKRYSKCVECNKEKAGLLESLRLMILTHVRRWLAGRVDFNITPTDWLATVLELPRMKTVHHGVSVGMVKPSDGASAETFAFQGRLVSTKGLGLLLEAAEHLQRAGCKFQLKVIGEGPEGEPLRSQAAGLDGRVKFLGHVPNERMGDALSDVATIVVPSLGGEVFGLVAAENMLRGKLVIVSDIGALREVVGDTGLVFVAGDAEGLAARMREVIEKSCLPGELGSAARARAMQVFKRESMIQGHVALYRKALLH